MSDQESNTGNGPFVSLLKLNLKMGLWAFIFGCVILPLTEIIIRFLVGSLAPDEMLLVHVMFMFSWSVVLAFAISSNDSVELLLGLPARLKTVLLIKWIASMLYIIALFAFGVIATAFQIIGQAGFWEIVTILASCFLIAFASLAVSVYTDNFLISFVVLVSSCMIALLAGMMVVPSLNHPINFVLAALSIMAASLYSWLRVDSILRKQNRLIRSYVIGCLLLVSVPGLIMAVVLPFSFLQKNSVDREEKRLAQNGISLKIEDVFPASTRSQCEGWLYQRHTELDQTESLKARFPVLRAKVSLFCNDLHLSSFQDSSINDILRESKITSSRNWEPYRAALLEGVKRMKSCPYVQWFAPEEYRDKIYEAPMPDLLDVIHRGRGLMVLSLVEFSKGKRENAFDLLTEIHGIYSRFNTKGQVLISRLVAIATDSYCSLGFAIFLNESSAPFRDDQISIIKGYAKEPRNFWKGGMLFETLLTFDLLGKHPQTAISWAGSLLPGGMEQWSKLVSGKRSTSLLGDIISSYETESVNGALPKTFSDPVVRASLYFYAADDAKFLTESGLWFKKVPDPQNGHFQWKEYRDFVNRLFEELSPGGLFPNMTNAYAREICIVAQWNSLLAANAVYEYLEETGRLPNSRNDISSGWGRDPFDEKDIKYKRFNDRSFAVYSVGPNMTDDRGGNLYMSGTLDTFKKGQDVGYSFTLKDRSPNSNGARN